MKPQGHSTVQKSPLAEFTEGMKESLFYNSWVPLRGQEYRKGWEGWKVKNTKTVRRWINHFPGEGYCPALKTLAPTELPREIRNTSLKFRDREDKCLPEELRRVRVRSDHPSPILSPRNGYLPAWRGQGRLCCGLPAPPKLLPLTHVHAWGVLGPPNTKNPRQTQLSRKKLDVLPGPGARKPAHMTTQSGDATSWERTLEKPGFQQENSKRHENAPE